VQGCGEFLGYWIAQVLELNGYEIFFFNNKKNTPKLFSNFTRKWEIGVTLRQIFLVD
jgi:hypothetical protein